MHSSELDEIDRRILVHLQRDARVTLVELSKTAYLSPPQCYRRIKRLEQNGIIKRCVALLDREKMGFGVMATVGLTRDKDRSQGTPSFDALLNRLPEILECYTVTGDFDYLLKVVAKDLKEFNVFLSERLLRVPGVISVRSAICLEEVKYSTALPIDLQTRRARQKGGGK
jgi:Lrp/AsnC family leucine-responsive transcriptional regulator